MSRTAHVVTDRTRSRREVITALLLALAVLGVLPAGGSPAAAQEGPGRIQSGAGDDPVALAVAACQALLPGGGASRVLLARDDAFADALAAAPLAGGDGCILYTPAAPAGLAAATRAEIDRVLGAGGRVEVLGGVDAIAQPVADELAGAGYDVRRLEGPTRYETAARIAEALAEEVGPAEQAIIAWGGGWPDAVTAGSFAAARGVPVLLTPTAQLHPAAAAAIRAQGISRTMIAGGTAVVSDAVAAQLPDPTRVAGDNRMGTAAELADARWPQTTLAAAAPAQAQAQDGTGPDEVLLLNLEAEGAWTAALAASPLSVARSAAQVGVRTTSLPAETAAYLEQLPAATPVTAVGSQSLVQDGVAQQAAAALGGGGTPPTAPGCDPAGSDADPELPPEATRVEQISADLDGDGEPDQLTTFRGEGQDTVDALHVRTASGYATIAVLDADTTAHVRPLGTATIGEGRPVVFVVEQVGASTINVSAFGLHAFDGEPCALGRVTIPDDATAPQFPIGSGNGLQCRDVAGTPALAVRSVQPSGADGSQYEWAETAYTWDGAGALRFLESSSGTYTSPEDDEEIRAFSDLDCPGVEQP